MQPHQTLYGGAHLFRPDSVHKIGQVALRSLLAHSPFDPELAARIEARLRLQPLEDMRVDFEDGFGARSDEEEDATADQVARNVLQAEVLPPRFGFRLKPLSPRWQNRALRTLERLSGPLRDLDHPLTLTLAKTESPFEVETIVRHLQRLGLDWQLELMVESPGALRQLARWHEAAAGRLRGVHFGPYDFLASCGQLAGDLHHPICRQAKLEMILQLAPLGLEWCDGPTPLLPLGAEPGPAWERHGSDLRRSWEMGYSQSWDLHPAQLVSHYAAVYRAYDLLLPPALEKLANFLAQSRQATRVGSEFDDMATIRVRWNLVERALACGQLEPADLESKLGGDVNSLRDLLN